MHLKSLINTTCKIWGHYVITHSVSSPQPVKNCWHLRPFPLALPARDSAEMDIRETKILIRRSCQSCKHLFKVARLKVSWKIENIWRPFPLCQLVLQTAKRWTSEKYKDQFKGTETNIVKLFFKEGGSMWFPDFRTWKYLLRPSPFSSWRHRAVSEGLEKSWKIVDEQTILLRKKELWIQICEPDCPWREMVKHSLATPWTSIFSNQPLPCTTGFLWENNDESIEYIYVIYLLVYKIYVELKWHFGQRNKKMVTPFQQFWNSPSPTVKSVVPDISWWGVWLYLAALPYFKIKLCKSLPWERSRCFL